MIIIRTIGIEEADSIFDLEKIIWPQKIQASKVELIRRLECFPEGVIGVWVKNMPVGYATCQVVNYNNKMDVDYLKRYLPQKASTISHHNPKGNCLDFLSCGIIPGYRRKGLWKLLIAYRISLAKNLGLEFILVDSRMPSYSTRSKEFQQFTPSDYSFATKNNILVDPYLAVFQKYSFVPIGAGASSYEDPESGNYWAFMVRENLLKG
jgi:hypothetical protein